MSLSLSSLELDDDGFQQVKSKIKTKPIVEIKKSGKPSNKPKDSNSKHDKTINKSLNQKVPVIVSSSQPANKNINARKPLIDNSIQQIEFIKLTGPEFTTLVNSISEFDLLSQESQLISRYYNLYMHAYLCLEFNYFILEGLKILVMLVIVL